MSSIPPSKPTGKDPAATVAGAGLRYPTNGKTIYSRTLNRTRTSELSQASFAYLFSEMVNYAQRRVKDIQDLEKRLNLQGHPIGVKLLDLLLFREPPRSQLRPRDIITLLHLIKIQLWTHLFGRQADRLEKSSNPDTPDEYMIIDNEPLVNAYLSVPKEMSQLNCAAYVAGMIEGVCDGAGFPARVTAHSVGGQNAAAAEGGAGGAEGGAAGAVQEMWPGKTVFLVKFQPEVLEREAYLGVNK
ncbi:Trafficking protein particle complex subunit 31 [Gnomoniopsis sp. IMI 355080]|nr:Trafficking protein particle complex subunit 31 [Gnomoniopsis sp. IMI 355080]